MNREDAFEFVGYELDWQNIKWKRSDGDWPSDMHHKLTVLAEEFGEVAMALNDVDYDELAEELADTAATCIAWLMADYELEG